MINDVIGKLDHVLINMMKQLFIFCLFLRVLTQTFFQTRLDREDPRFLPKPIPFPIRTTSPKEGCLAMMTLLFNALSTVKDSMNIPTSFLFNPSYRTKQMKRASTIVFQNGCCSLNQAKWQHSFSDFSPFNARSNKSNASCPICLREYECWKSPKPHSIGYFESRVWLVILLLLCHDAAPLIKAGRDFVICNE